jgi:uncharacterized protein
LKADSDNKKSEKPGKNTLFKEDSVNFKSGFRERFYRDHMGEGRFRAFTITCKDSDLWIGVDNDSFLPEIVNYAIDKLFELRYNLESYIRENPEFKTSFIPVKSNKGEPEIAAEMNRAAKIAGTGPMAAVAGAFSENIGKAIQNKFKINEIVVENGGDIYLKINHNLIISVYAGLSPLSGKIGIEIPAKSTPLGICTSAGTVGPSFSFGKADAVMIASKSTAIADALATAFGNRIKKADDISDALELVKNYENILSALIICEGNIGIYGQFNVKPIFE